MRFAVLDIVHPRQGVPHADTYQEHLEQVRLADDLGFDHYWFLEHHLHSGSLTPSPNLLVAAAAPLTRRIRLGSMVNILPFRNPVILAEELAMLDNLTQGRLDVGIGRGLKPDEFQALGVPMAESRPMFDEALQVLLGVWANDTVQFQGKYFFADKQAPLRPSLVQQPHPPLYMSAASQESLRWTAERDMSSARSTARCPLAPATPPSTTPSSRPAGSRASRACFWPAACTSARPTPPPAATPCRT